MLHVCSKRTLLLALLGLISSASATSYSNPLNINDSKQVELKQGLNTDTNVTKFLSYHEWKNLKIQEAQTKVKSARSKISPDPNLRMNSGVEAGLNQELEREILNLSLTNDLTITDYFVGYLTKQQPLSSAIKEVSAKLTPDEIAELMSAYAEHFDQNSSTAVRGASRADFN